ncbi:nuclear transport factor 2 family protein [Phyllobacterium sp. UNC302MFCol5.2]|uniref:nuclear transport factor 2 family protein n=1 Tax=Phyllobacterium sp. UNC302MFCol5.2 TaxID=1449065 RepID=UPI0004873AC4|nr:nuclear transport factor 2 family protein [Phyllobacterium sp. UNC302MFCol5.2]
MVDNNIAVARASYDAYVAKDRDAMERLVAEDFHFTSPLDNGIDRQTYFERCWPTSYSIEAFSFIHLVAQGNEVFVTYEGKRSDGHRFRNTEILTIRDGKIAAVEVYFGWSLPHDAKPGSFVNPK